MSLRSPGPQRRTAIGVAAAVVVAVAVGATVVILGARSHHSATGGSGAVAVNPSFLALYREDVSGVVRVDASTCSGTGIGSGFLVAPTLVVTAAHVLDGAVAVGVTAGTTTTTGHVIGIDSTTDVALVRTRAQLPGHVFGWSPSQVGLKAAIAVIGYPEGDQTGLRPGHVRHVGRSLEVEGIVHRDLLQTDASVDGSYSGGPVLVTSGAVAGLVDDDQSAARPLSVTLAYAVPAIDATRLVAHWSAAASPPPSPTCPAPRGPATTPSVATADTGRDTAAIASGLATYFDAIDAGRYGRAYAMLSPEQRSAASEDRFATSHSGSYDYDMALTSVRVGPGATDRAGVSFTSLQPSGHGPYGATCAQWTLTYTMIRAQGRWLIDGGTGAGPGGLPSRAC